MSSIQVTGKVSPETKDLLRKLRDQEGLSSEGAALRRRFYQIKGNTQAARKEHGKYLAQQINKILADGYVFGKENPITPTITSRISPKTIFSPNQLFLTGSSGPIKIKLPQ